MDERVLHGIELFNSRQYFVCHEVLEEVWTPERGPRRLFLQALIHFAVEWWRGQHPTAIIVTDSGPKLAGELFPPLLMSILAFTLLYAFVMIVRVRLEQQRDRISAMQAEVA